MSARDRRRAEEREESRDDRRDEASRNDQRASEKVGGSGDPTDEPAESEASRNDQRASEKVGGSGDPTDEPAGGDNNYDGGDDDDTEPASSNDPISSIVGGVRNRVDDVTTGVSDAVSDVSTGVSERIDDVGSTINDVRSGVSGRVDDVQTSVGGRIDDVQDTVDDVQDTVSDVGDQVTDVADDVSDGASGTIDDVSNTVGDVSDDVTAGIDDTVSDVGTGIDNTVSDVRNTVDDVTSNPADDIDTGITDDLTTGGFLSEDAGDDSGLLSGSFEGVTPAGTASVDVSEAAFRERSESIDTRAEQAFGSNPELTIFGSDAPDRLVTGAAEAATDVANVPGLVVSGETATEVATNAPGEIREEGAGAVGSTALGVGVFAGQAAVESAREDPVEFAGGAGFGLVAGAGASRQVGRVGRGVRDRVRTAGGREIPARELASDDVVRFSETDGATGTRFPGAADEGLYQTDPAAAVRQQADEFTPESIDDIFGDEGGDTTLFKGLDVEPEGPATGRADTGFASAPGETLADFDYETPGSFFGPELSPNFLGVDGGAGFSFRPGLPDTGNNPTAVAARTDVENPDADTLDGFNRELVERAGETTARTKPPDEVNPGEIEAVVPPGSEFRPVGGGGAAGSAGARAGVGSEVFTTIAGRRVPIRTVAPDDATASDTPSAGVSAVTRRGSRSLDDISERVEQPTDRPVAGSSVAGGSAATSSGSASPSTDDPFSFGGGSASGGSSSSSAGSSGGGSGSSGSGSSGGSSSTGGGPASSSGPVSSVDDLLGGSVAVGSPTTTVSGTSSTSPPTSTSVPPSSVDAPGGSSTVSNPPDRRGGTPISGGGPTDLSGTSTISPPSTPPSTPPGSPGTPPGSPGGPGGPPELDGERDSDRDEFTFALDAEDDVFGSGVLSGDEAVDQVFGRR